MLYIVLGLVTIFVPSLSYLLVRNAWNVRKRELIKLREEIISMKTNDENLKEYLEEIEKLLNNEFRDFAFVKRKYNVLNKHNNE